ncbi:MAG: DUF3795 domain-containing protein [Candidatus Thorarchaeota archaeon]
MENSIAVCGLECGKCDIYLCDENEEVASNLLSWFKKEGWRNEDITVQDFMNEGKKCLGCRGNRDVAHWSASCDILICCVDEKQLDSCHICSDFVCEKLTAWGTKSEKYSQALDRLKELNNLQGFL